MNNDDKADMVLASKGLQPLTAALLEAVTPGDVATVIVERGLSVLSADAGLVALIDEDGCHLDLIESQGYTDNLLDYWRKVPVSSNSPLANAVRAKAPSYISSAEEWEQLFPGLVDKRSRKTAASVDLPLQENERVFGGLHFSFAEPRVFTESDRAFLAELARQCTLALSRAISRSRAEDASRRQQFLVRASEVLAASLDYEQTLEDLSKLAVPDFVDAAQVYIIAERDGALQRLAVAHRYPELNEVLSELHARYPISRYKAHPTFVAISTGKSQLIEEIDDDTLRLGASDAAHLRLLRRLRLHSTFTVPLIARGATFGAITFVLNRDSGRSFTKSSLAFLEEVVRHAAVHVDNKRLYADAQREISERKAAEARKAAVVEAALDCIITIDERESVIEWNPAAEKTFGYSRGQVIGRNLSELIIPERLQGALGRSIAHFLETGQGQALFKRIEMSALRSNGEEFPAELTAIPINLGGNFLFTAYLRDISERDMLMAQRRTLVRDMLMFVTGGKMRLCETPANLPSTLTPASGMISLAEDGGIASLRRTASKVAESLGFPPDRSMDLMTAVSEAAMNAVIHGGGGIGQVYEDEITGKVQVVVTDQGSGIEFDTLPQATLVRGFSTTLTLGHGLKMIMELVDRVYLLTGDTGTTLMLEQDRAEPLPAWLTPESIAGVESISN